MTAWSWTCSNLRGVNGKGRGPKVRRLSVKMGIRASRRRERKDPFEEACQAIAKAKRITVFTGAGISVDSGIADFRSPGGLWTKFNPAIYCDYEVFLQRPDKFWEMVLHLYKDIHLKLGGAESDLEAGNIRQPQPNAGHKAISNLAKLGKNVTVVTQNIDGLHKQAGSSNVIELHGTDSSCTCCSCGRTFTRDPALRQLKEALADGGQVPVVPKCDDCGGVLKPNIILFGEPLPTGAIMKALKSVIASSVVLVVGTSLEVAPANMIPGVVKYRPFGKLIIQNLDNSGKEQADHFLQGRSSDILPEVVKRVEEIKGL